ncbi:hypothetical protein LAZ67_4000992 [Cordylochernes scorpioides]|uniref:Metalloendopeptidase n=1 Tax=Cordylochernes scorpioides TaxID=51811 RepID=A0ABY6KBM1_9ARAC|nr:hypothetical protein LAZ67_4000992 [Cordylochernes scorpioides]
MVLCCLIIAVMSRCSSYVGKSLKGGVQTLLLAPGCKRVGSILHELNHAVGFHHEHKRTDRDNYIIIHMDRIKPNKTHNFEMLKPKDEKILDDFDYNSIMLYYHDYFAINKTLYTIETLDGTKLEEVHNKTLSQSDIKRINRLYNCPKKYLQ